MAYVGGLPPAARFNLSQPVFARGVTIYSGLDWFLVTDARFMVYVDTESIGPFGSLYESLSTQAEVGV
jgi:hypothetical protein